MLAEFWPVGYLTSARDDWLAPAIEPKPNPATEVNVTSPNRDWDEQFSSYRGGINGTCSICMRGGLEPPSDPGLRATH